MPRTVKIISQQRVFDQFFKIDEARLQYELFNGQMSPVLTRLNFNRGDSAAVLLHDQQQDTIVLVEQFRYPAYTKGRGWLLEIPAGAIEAVEAADPGLTVRRELLEEIGYRVTDFTAVASFFVSPGGTSERIHLFYAAVRPHHKIAAGGGLAREGENIRTVVMGVPEALHQITTGEIMDAKTIIALQWLQLHHDKLPPSNAG